MAKASASKKKPAVDPERAKVQPDAAEIAEIDRQIAALIQRRAEAVKMAVSSAAAEASHAGLETLAIDRILEQSPGPLPQAAMRAVFRELNSGCRAVRSPPADRAAGADL